MAFHGRSPFYYGPRYSVRERRQRCDSSTERPNFLSDLFIAFSLVGPCGLQVEPGRAAKAARPERMSEATTHGRPLTGHISAALTRRAKLGNASRAQYAPVYGFTDGAVSLRIAVSWVGVARAVRAITATEPAMAQYWTLRTVNAIADSRAKATPVDDHRHGSRDYGIQGIL